MPRKTRRSTRRGNPPAEEEPLPPAEEEPLSESLNELIDLKNIIDDSDLATQILNVLLKSPDYPYGKLSTELLNKILDVFKITATAKNLVGKVKDIAVSGVVYFCYRLLRHQLSTDTRNMVLSLFIYKEIFTSPGRTLEKIRI